MLLHKLVSETFLHSPTPGCLQANVRHVFLPAQADDLKDSLSAKNVTERQEAWKQDIPTDDDAVSARSADRLDVFAVVTNAVFRGAPPAVVSRHRDAV